MDDNYSERIAAAMKNASCSTSALASALGISYQAVKKVLDGKSNALTAENNAKAARFLGISSNWLATGEGEMLPPTSTANLTPSSVTAFPVVSLEAIMERLSHYLDQVPQADRGSSSAALAALALHPEDHKRKSALLRLLIADGPITQKTATGTDNPPK